MPSSPRCARPACAGSSTATRTGRPRTWSTSADALAERWVLPDWDLDGAEPRGGFLEFVEGRPRLVFFDD